MTTALTYLGVFALGALALVVWQWWVRRRNTAVLIDYTKMLDERRLNTAADRRKSALESVAEQQQAAESKVRSDSGSVSFRGYIGSRRDN